MPVEEQVVSIYAGVNGYLDDIAADKVSDFEQALMADVRSSQGALLEQIRTEKQLTDDIKSKLNAAIGDFAKRFAG